MRRSLKNELIASLVSEILSTKCKASETLKPVKPHHPADLSLYTPPTTGLKGRRVMTFYESIISPRPINPRPRRKQRLNPLPLIITKLTKPIRPHALRGLK
jgi:hypothetical protein